MLFRSKEKGRFVPKAQTPESSIHFMQGMLDIAMWVEKERHIKIFSPIFRDIGNYLYPILSIQAMQPFPVFLKYSFGLAKMGFWKSKMFYVYFMAILLLGTHCVDTMIRWIKKRLGHTPSIGAVYKGETR